MVRAGATRTERNYTGNANELRAASWFARNGYNIYLPVGSPPSDFVAIRGDLTVRVQVKTMTWQPRESCYAMKVSWGKYAAEQPNVFACMGSAGEMWVVPAEALKVRRTLRLKIEGPFGADWRVI